MAMPRRMLLTLLCSVVVVMLSGSFVLVEGTDELPAVVLFVNENAGGGVPSTPFTASSFAMLEEKKSNGVVMPPGGEPGSPPLNHTVDAVSIQVPVALGLGLLVMVLGMVASRANNVSFVVAGFMTCSSMMLVINKVAITMFPYPGTLLTLQLLFSALGMWIGKATSVVEVEPLTIQKILQFGVTPLAFLMTLVANIKILEYANVETFIMVRTSTPLATSILDYLLLGRELPSMRSAGGLILAFLGSCVYMVTDSSFELRAYSWALAWLTIFLFDQIYIKHVITTVQMTNWSRVYYTNFLAAIPCLAFSVVNESAPENLGIGWKGSWLTGATVVGVSCVMGLTMSFFSFYVRDLLSATSFTVVGNVCKVLSVLVNVFIWEKHASKLGLVALSFCIAGAAIYRPAPLRSEGEKTPLKKDSSV